MPNPGARTMIIRGFTLDSRSHVMLLRSTFGGRVVLDQPVRDGDQAIEDLLSLG